MRDLAALNALPQSNASPPGNGAITQSSDAKPAPGPAKESAVK
jgi:hypothetical protein